MDGALASHLWQPTLFAVSVGLPTLAFRTLQEQLGLTLEDQRGAVNVIDRLEKPTLD